MFDTTDLIAIRKALALAASAAYEAKNDALGDNYLDLAHKVTGEINVAEEIALTTKPVHTAGGSVIGDPNGKYPNGIQYGTTHDMDCPGCANTPFTASPRSETYWAS